MKNKRTRVIVMILVGFVAMGASQSISGSNTGNFLGLVGAILLIGGIVEIFRKPKTPTV